MDTKTFTVTISGDGDEDQTEENPTLLIAFGIVALVTLLALAVILSRKVN